MALAGYLNRKSMPAAFLVGLAAGVGMWNRANFGWFLGSLFVASLLVLKRRFATPIRNAIGFLLGGVIGALPMLVYHFLSQWVVFDFIKTDKIEGSMASLVAMRLRFLQETLISDTEQRTIWAGPPSPVWQPFACLLVVGLGLIICLVWKKGDEKAIALRRIVSTTAILFALLMLTSRQNIAPHHLVTLVPVVVIGVVCAMQALTTFRNRFRIIGAVLAVAYLALALYWNVLAAQGLRATGGVNMWSSAVYELRDYLEANCAGHQIAVLDWGLQNNLYVLSSGRLNMREIFWGATERSTVTGVPWFSLVAQGGVFVTNAPETRHFPAASQGFFAALASSGRPFETVEFHQKRGAGYALVVVIPRPGAAQSLTQSATRLTPDHGKK
jgi:hypothetical protein